MNRRCIRSVNYPDHQTSVTHKTNAYLMFSHPGQYCVAAQVAFAVTLVVGELVAVVGDGVARQAHALEILAGES
jgi:hypothetical protein